MKSEFPTDIRIREVGLFFSVESPSAEFAFGGSTAGSLTLAHVRVRVEDRRGKSATGWGAIFLSHPWAFPGATPTPIAKDALMRAVIEGASRSLETTGEFGHPLDHYLIAAGALESITKDAAESLGIHESVPPLCSLVAFSPIDSAIHDAYGNLHGIGSFDALDDMFLAWDLSRVLGPSFRGRYPGDYLRPTPAAVVPVSHTVGATDPLRDEDRTESSIPGLGWWIARDGVTSFKVKLKGQSLEWDLARLVDVHTIASEVAGKPVRIFGDLNEGAPSVEYISALLDELEATAPDVFAALDALEQPFSRGRSDQEIASVGAVSSRAPIVLDEGLTSLETLDTAIQRGWNGVALKTCKTQSLMLMTLARTVEDGLSVSVQDLTNPGIALLHSLSLAARLPQTVPMETNQRQYFPATSAPEATIYPEIFQVRDGRIPTANLGQTGFGYQIERINRDIFQQD